jgi:hypothetical protein
MKFLFLLICLVGCNFKPLYERTNDYHVLPTKVSIIGAEDEVFYSYKFKKELALHLEHFANKIQEKPIKIRVVLSISFGNIGYGSDVTVLRTSGRAIANLSIYNENGSVAYENKLDAVSSYTLDINEDFSNLCAQEADKNRIITSLAQDVATDIKRGLHELDLKGQK